MIRHAWTAIGLSAAVLAGCGSDDGATPQPASDAELFDSTLAELESDMTTEGIPGLSIAVVLDGKLAFSAGLGVKAKSTQEAVTAHTLFRVCSMTKMMTSAAVLDLAEEGKVDLHAPIQTYAPFLEFSATEPVTLHHVLSNTAGIVTDYYDQPHSTGKGAFETWFTAHGPLPQPVAPGALFKYSNVGFGAAAAVIEKVTDHAFDEELRDRVLAPMGMTTATLDASAAMQGDHATGHGTLGGSKVESEIPIDTPDLTFAMWNAAGGVIASAEDYGYFVESLLAGGGILEPASVDALTASHTPTGWGEGWSYGYGTWSMQLAGERAVLHAGGSHEGWTSYVGWVPSRKLGVVLLTNSNYLRTLPYLSKEILVVLARFLRSDAALPDFTTQPSDWGKYVGSYSQPDLPTFTFDVTRDEGGELWIKPILTDAPVKLEEGDPGFWHSGAATFHTSDRTFTFWPGPSGAIEYLDAGETIALRQP
jgi:CubicO group peptidase (beta-lactamase class C family)